MTQSDIDIYDRRFKNFNCLEFFSVVILNAPQDLARAWRQVLGGGRGVEGSGPAEKALGNVSLLQSIRNIKDNMNLTEEIPTPREWCAVLMSTKFRRCHIGLYLNGRVLHTEKLRPIMNHKISDLPKYGYFLEGFYEPRRI